MTDALLFVCFSLLAFEEERIAYKEDDAREHAENAQRSRGKSGITRGRKSKDDDAQEKGRQNEKAKPRRSIAI